jgi:xanthine dehydrogenase YagR molybdenum-binding subunit
VAAASWGAYRFGCSTTVELGADGKARARCATQDVGTGLYTIFAQVLAEKTGLSFDRIEVILGDTTMPEGPLSGGSWSTATVLPAVASAADGAIAFLLQIAASTKGTPLAGADAKTLRLTEGRVHRVGEPTTQGVPFEQVLTLARLNRVSADGRSGSAFEDPKAKGLSMHSFGAQFVEVEWEPEIARLRVSRVVTVIDAGRIINPRAGANQIKGAVVMGVGMALLEETVYDPRNGQPINGNLADYLMPTCADSPEIDVTFLDYPDYALNSYGARGIGEIGLAGVAPAIASAVYHATGVRVRKLPIRIEDMLQSEIRQA